MQFFSGAVLVIVLIVLIVLIFRALSGVRKRRAVEAARRQVELAQRWETATGLCRSNGHLDMAFVDEVYQYASRGCKALLVWSETGDWQDAWFWGAHLEPGNFVIVRGNTAYGPHNDNPDVLYVDPGDLVEVVPLAARAAWLSLNK